MLSPKSFMKWAGGKGQLLPHGDFFVTDWLRNRNTMEFLGVWERIYNPDFNYGEFATIRNQSGLNSFKISVKKFVARTGANSLCMLCLLYNLCVLHSAKGDCHINCTCASECIKKCRTPSSANYFLEVSA